jgi:hypothetical protein
MYLAGGMDYTFKSVTLGVRNVKSGRVNCVTQTHCSVMGVGFKCVTP